MKRDEKKSADVFVLRGQGRLGRQLATTKIFPNAFVFESTTMTHKFPKTYLLAPSEKTVKKHCKQSK